MPKWIQLPSDPMFYQPDQAAFFAACKRRHCLTCAKDFDAEPPVATCPTCSTAHVPGYVAHRDAFANKKVASGHEDFVLRLPAFAQLQQGFRA